MDLVLRNDIVFAIGPAGTGKTYLAVALAVRMMRQGLYRRLCFHEEISQSLGLFNDDPTVRPSIFNDDDEFALLTTHDEYLLRILYDPRLKAGMTADEAMPVVARIVEELRPGG